MVCTTGEWLRVSGLNEKVGCNIFNGSYTVLFSVTSSAGFLFDSYKAEFSLMNVLQLLMKYYCWVINYSHNHE